MEDVHVSAAQKPARRPPWNKGKLVGAKPPLRPSHVWSIRTKLQIEGWKRDLALFNLAIDSKLRGCDLVAVRVDDVAPSGCAMDRATIRQKKTGRPVRFEMTDQTRLAIDDYANCSGAPSTCVSSEAPRSIASRAAKRRGIRSRPGMARRRRWLAASAKSRRVELRRDFIAFHDGFPTELGICVPREYLLSVGVRR